MRHQLKYILPALVLVVAGSLFVFRAKSGDPAGTGRPQNVPNVKVELPQRKTVTSALDFTGDMVAIQQAAIFSKVNGNLEHVSVDLGSAVRKNQLLALIDTTELHQTYEQAKATYENARALYERNLTLFKSNLVSKQDVDNTATAMKVAKSMYENAATRLGYAYIRAPFAGTITRRFVDPGANITSNNSTLFMLMDMDSMRIFVNILEKDIPNVAIGKRAVIRVDAYPDRVFEGVVSRLSQAVDLSTRTMAVQIDIPNRDHLLKPGMFASVKLIVEEHPNALTAPSEAILADEQGSFVYAADGSRARLMRVRLGIVQDDRTEIVSGLTDSVHVIVTGQQFVRPDAPISVQ